MHLPSRTEFNNGAFGWARQWSGADRDPQPRWSAMDDLSNRVQNSRTIWHETHSVPRQYPKNELALFQGHMVLASGETAACAGVEVVNMSDGNEPFTGHLMVQLADGSVSNQTFEGVTTSRESETRFSGTVP